MAAIAASSACSVEAVKFSPPTDAPLADAPVTDAAPDAKPDAQPDAPLPLVENCAVVGDEDGNGAADCRDPACVAGVSTCAESAACNTDCSISVCGDNKRNMAAGEACDSGAVDTATCDADCTPAVCGDNRRNNAAGEACDTGGDSATCDADCTPAVCGDNRRNNAAGEACDMGTADTATCDGDCTLPACNDGRLNTLAGEERDPPTSPVSSVPINRATCRYDFSGINQLYCTGSCGAWGGGIGCQQADADAFCKLKTGNPAATAAPTTPVGTTVAPGICCPNQMVGGCVLLGRLPSRGVALDIYVHNTDLHTSHTGGQVIANPTCLVP